ncbi:hypothetical protein [Vibrio sp. WXL210]|uniref:hypothetical protein n=1 Tax=Vibrio sp. WXL210 TaxID=3450709 RepID=UPI003EC897D4
MNVYLSEIQKQLFTKAVDAVRDAVKTAEIENCDFGVYYDELEASLILEMNDRLVSLDETTDPSRQKQLTFEVIGLMAVYDTYQQLEG